MAAVVAPIGIDHPQLGHGGVTMLLVPEIIPAEQQVGKCHGKSHRVEICLHFLVVPHGKAGYTGHVGGDVGLHVKALRLVHGGKAGFHGVHQIGLDFVHLVGRNAALDGNDPCGEHLGALLLGEQLHALGGGVCPLVILAGQVFHGEHLIIGGELEVLAIHIVHIGLGEDGATGGFKFFRREAVNIVAIEQAQVFNGGKPQILPQIRLHVPGFHVEAGLLFHKYSDNHSMSIPFLCRPAAAGPKSQRKALVFIVA